MEVRNIDLGFGVSIEQRSNEYAQIHNLKSWGKDVSPLGVKLR